MAAPTLIADTECYRNYWLFAAKRISDGKIVTLEKSDRCELDRGRLERIMRSHEVVGFNLYGYDQAMIWAAIWGASNERLKEISDEIIIGRVPWWRVEEVVGRRLPRTNVIDLIEPQPNAIASLKTLNGRLHGPKMQDLPFEPDRILTHAEMDIVTGYCGNDLDSTHLLFDALKEPLELRAAISKDLDLDVRSKSDTQVGFAILKKRVEDKRGERLTKPDMSAAGRSFHYRVPEFIDFQTPQLRDLLDQIRTHRFVVKPNGKVGLPKFLSDARIQIGPSTFQMGLGGLHSTEANRSVYSDNHSVLVDADVASYYPAIILALGLYPPAMGPETLQVYLSIRNERIAAKLAKLKTVAESLKISLNGFFGLTSNPHSPAYSPQMTIAITLTGQLALLMLIESAHQQGIPAISGNTDGVTFLCPRDQANPIDDKGRLTEFGEFADISFSATLKEITDRWEKATGFDLEFVRYRSMHSASVNTYFAVKEDGKVKRKGLYSNPWNDSAAIREQLMKNPNMTICSDAALAFITHGTPVEQTIRECDDIRQFVTVVNVRGGGTWHGEYLGKVVRYIWSKDGLPILYKEPHEKTGNYKKVSKTDGCRPMMTLEDTIPFDLDYQRYVEEAKEILRDVGVLAAAPAPLKVPRMTKKALRPWLMIGAVVD